MTLMDIAEHKKTGREWFEEGRNNYKKSQLVVLKGGLENFKTKLLECTNDTCRERYKNVIEDIKEVLKEEYVIEGNKN